MTQQRLRQRSSADSLLRGMKYGGSRIAGVFKGAGTQRTIKLENGKSASVHRADIHELAKIKGLILYKEKYAASNRAGKQKMVRKSTARQKSLLRGHIARLRGEAAAMPARRRSRLLARIKRLRGQKYGSPLIGKRPASDLIAGRSSRTYVNAKRAGVKVR